MNLARFRAIPTLLVLFPLALAACSGADGATGKDGTAGKDGVATASISGIAPGRVFSGRTAKLTISGVGTNWTDATPVSFSDTGITVKSVKAASPSALMVTIDVAGDAVIKDRDVLVGDVAAPAKFSGFTVESPISVTIEGSPAQGSILTIQVKNKDIENPFDTTLTGGSIFSAGEYTGIKASVLSAGKAIDGLALTVGTVTAQSVTFTGLVDVDLAAKSYDLSIDSGSNAVTIPFLGLGALPIAARTASKLSASDSFTQGAFESHLYELATVKDQLSFFAIAPSAALPTGAQPQLLILDAPGHFATDVVSAGATYTVFQEGAGAKLFGIALDATGAKGYKLNVSQSSATPAAVLAEAEPNDTMAQAQVATAFPFVLKGATLTSAADQDWIRITAPGGKKLHAQTAPGDTKTDTLLTIFAADGTTVVGKSDDSNYHEDFTTPSALAAAIYYVRVSASEQTAPAVGSNKYIAILRFE